MKRQATEGRKYFQIICDKRLIPKIYKELIQLHDKKTIWFNNVRWVSLNRHFSKDKTQMAKGYEKCPTSLSRKCHRKNITPTSVRITIIKNARNNKCWRAYEKREPWVNCWWKCKLVWPEGKTVWRLLRKLKIEAPHNPAILILGVYPKEMNSLSPKDTYPKFTENYLQ